MMKHLLSWCAGGALAVMATAASAIPGTFLIDQVYSNADGTVQFVAVVDTGRADCDSGEAAWAGQVLVSRGPAPQKTFVFPANLPTCKTSARHILIATQGFAALGLVAPDFVIPNGFLQIPNGAVDLADVTSVTYAALPNDGIHSIDASGKPMQNVAINLAGASASVVPGPVSTLATVVEYYNATLDHYFITWLPAEIAILDAGVQIRGWVRTGTTFLTHTAAQPGSSPVCRFYIPPGLGDSHFFGRGTVECAATGAKQSVVHAGGPRVHADDPPEPGHLSRGNDQDLPGLQQSPGCQSSLHDRSRDSRPDGRQGLGGRGAMGRTSSSCVRPPKATHGPRSRRSAATHGSILSRRLKSAQSSHIPPRFDSREGGGETRFRARSGARTTGSSSLRSSE